jgi:Glyoxalase-like domain
VVRVPDLGQARLEAGSAFGEAMRVTRGARSWLISVPPDGSMPFDGTFPTLIEWPAGPHPASRMADPNCRLEHLVIVHPEGARLTVALDPIFRNERVSISGGDAVQLRAAIKTPDGLRELT